MATHYITVEGLTVVLNKAGLINDDQAAQIKVKANTQRARLKREIQDQKGRKSSGEISAAEVIASMGLLQGGDPSRPLDEDVIVRTLAGALGRPYEKIDPIKLDAQLITGTVSLPFARRTSVLPLRLEGEHMVVAVAEPHDEALFDELSRICARPLAIVLSARSDIQRSITEVYGFKRSVASAAREMSPTIDLGNLEQLVRLSNVSDIEGNEKHVVNAVEYVLHYAFDQRASDIHIEPKRDHSQIRMRIDGVLHDIYRVPKAVHAPIVTRLKTLTRLDLAERRRPQDGRFKTNKEGEEVEMRVSTLPVAFGEKVVIRIFDPGILFKEISELGFDDVTFQRYREFVERPNGLVLVTGPTGSGKTTTLYSTLRHLSTPKINISTIEDPIEMVCEDFNQTAVHARIGLDFATSLRHILRQDPDIIMVGEIRDPETANQALQAALTGHLVFSTLHTTDTAGSITRLLELGLNPFLVSSTLVGVVAQRLVRKVCESCKQTIRLTAEQIEILDIALPAAQQEDGLLVREGGGCVRCRGTGLYGRAGVFELLSVTDSIRQLINERADSATIARAARADGTISLREDAVRTLALGETSYEEVVRVTVDEGR